MNQSLLYSAILQNVECIEILYITYCSALPNNILIAISIIIYIISPIFISLSVIWKYIFLLTSFSPLFRYRSVTISSIYGLTHSRFDIRWMNKWMVSICHSGKFEIPYSLKLLNLYSLFCDAQELFYHNQKISVVNKKYRHKRLEIFTDYISRKCVYSSLNASYSFRDIKVNYIEILFFHFYYYCFYSATCYNKWRMKTLDTSLNFWKVFIGP